MTACQCPRVIIAAKSQVKWKIVQRESPSIGHNSLIEKAAYAYTTRYL